MSKYLALICLLFSTLSICNGQTVTAVCGNKIQINVVADSDFPVASSDERANASGLVLGYTEYCTANGVAPAPECEFSESVTDNFDIEIDNFNSCGISSTYNSAGGYTEVTMIVSRIPYMNSNFVRRSECGSFAVICRYDKTLEDVTYDTSVNITTHPYVGTDLTEDANAVFGLHLVSTSPSGSTPGTDIVPGTFYNLTDTVYVEARMVDNTDKFVATLYNCYASKTDVYNDDYELIDNNGCANAEDGTVQVDDGTLPTTPRYFPYFSFEAFVWTSLEHTIYLQCDIDMCLEGNNDCINDMTRCPNMMMNRFRRRTSNLKTGTIISGPINVQQILSKLHFSENQFRL